MENEGKSTPQAQGDLQQRSDVHVAANRCPYCHEDVSVEGQEAWVSCAACLGRHHAACWDELGACGSCQGTTRLVRDEGERPTRAGRLGGLVAIGLALTLAVVFWRQVRDGISVGVTLAFAGFVAVFLIRRLLDQAADG